LAPTSLSPRWKDHDGVEKSLLSGLQQAAGVEVGSRHNQELRENGRSEIRQHFAFAGTTVHRERCTA